MRQPPVIQIIGYSGSGKTTLVCKLIEWLQNRGMVVGTIKHDAHTFEMDQPGKDTWKYRDAGAKVVAISSAQRSAILEERHRTLKELVEKMDNVDLILVEGYKLESYPKYLVVKGEDCLSLLNQADGLIGLIARFHYEHERIPTFSADDIDAIGNHMLSQLT